VKIVSPLAKFTTVFGTPDDMRNACTSNGTVDTAADGIRDMA
jgi:hypothetical protein